MMSTASVPTSNQAFVLPASFAQQRLWFLDRLEPDRASYNVPLALRLRGALDVGALARALRSVVERHESLRTVFTVVDGVPHQLVAARSSLELATTDLSALDDAQARAIAYAQQQARQPFDLSTGPLLRAELWKLGAEDYVFALTVHHIVTDAWSMTVLVRELTALYGAFVSGKEANLPELSIQYGDYAAWQQQWVRSGGLDEQLAYWKRQLTGAPALLELPTDHPRPARQSFRGATVRTVLPRSLLEGVRALGEREGATLFMTLLAGFTTLLSRSGAQNDVVVGSPVANRNRVELEGVVGLLINTLALRVDLAGDPSFVELLSRVRETALGAFSNQDLPFEKVVEELGPERHLSHAPVAQVLFVLQNLVRNPASFPGLTQERIVTERGTAKFDLALLAAETPEGLRVSLEYCTDLFEEATVLRMLEHYRFLLEAAMADPTCPVSKLRPMSAPERQRVLHSFSEVARDESLDSERPVHESVSEQALRTPDAVAVVSAGERLSYSQLDSRANQLAGRLRDLGVRADVVVAIWAERSVEMVIAVLATLKAGGAYAPIDPSLPAERVAFMVSDAEAKVLLTQQHLVGRLPRTHAQVMLLDTNHAARVPDDDAAPWSAVAPEHLAYVIYTSGSTGQPKGVAMSHRPLANLLAWQLDTWAKQGRAPAPARTLQFASLSFDVAFQEIFSTWCSGGTLVLVRDDARRDPAMLLGFLREQRVQRLFLPFVALQSLCEAAQHLDVSVPSLRQVITAGEQLEVTEPIRRFFTAHEDCSLVNQYGPTESHAVTAFELPGPPERWPRLPPIGRPIAGAKLYLLDRHQQPVPIGWPGELHIGGVSLARGYLNRAELTRERFVTDPFSDNPYARLYRTGDLARHLPDGTIEYLGRTDQQVKIRGYRVELGEIESVLRKHPAVRQAVVIAHGDHAPQKRLVAYLIGEQAAHTRDELRKLLRRSLPEYMVPSAFVFLDAFPLTHSGKLDRASLANAPLGEQHDRDELRAPRSETELRLAEIWRKVLGLNEVGVQDNFFEIGGHSLMAVRVFSDIERKLGVRLPLSVLFETPTIAGLANVLEQARDEEIRWSPLVRMRPGDLRAPFFLVSEVDGELLHYRALVENLDPGRPVFGLLAPGMDGRTPPLGTVEQLAVHYVDAIRRFQPHGPYYLGGFCFAGVVAYEIARRLRESGETVAVLALIDAYPWGSSRRRGRLEKERIMFRAFKDADLRGKLAWPLGRAAGLVKLIWYAYLGLGPRIYEVLAARNLEHLMPRRPWNLVYAASRVAHKRYVPKSSDVQAQFFRPQPGISSESTPWHALARHGVELHAVVAPGIDHLGMMDEPHVRLIAAELTRALEAGQPA